MEIDQRVMIRIPEIDTVLLGELITTATDRINLRLGVTSLPPELNSVVVEVVCALYNRKYHQGIKDEKVDSFTVTFVDDILKEYDRDFQLYLSMKEKQENQNRGVVRFL